MTAILTFLGARLGGGIAAAVVATLVLGLGVQTARLAGAHRDVTKLTDRIENPSTGYIAKLSTCQGNVAGLESAVKAQNSAVAAIGAESARKMDIASVAVTAAIQGRASAEGRAAKLLRSRPAGLDACARMQAADNAVLEALQ